MTQQIEITLKMAPAGAELIVQTLRRATPLPDANIDGFIAELWAQYQAQVKAAIEAQQAAQAEAPAAANEAPAAPENTTDGGAE